MDNSLFNFNDAEFSYFISSKASELFKRFFYLSKGGLVISHSEKTVVFSHSTALEELCIIGLCIDSLGEIERFDIPKFILEQGGGRLLEIINLTKRFAGRFIVIYAASDETYVWGDATGSLQINYCLSEEICLSSCDELIRTFYQYDIWDRAEAIRRAADYSQPLPSDLTMCSRLRVLLPNHYLKVYAKEAVRFGPSLRKPLSKQELEGLIEKDIDRVNNILKEYLKYYQVICPLTGGWDSRLNLAFLKQQGAKPQCFTFKHKRFTEKSGDCYIPTMMCKEQGITHHMVEDISAPQEYIEGINNIIGSYHSRDTIDLAFTFNSYFKGKAIIGGDIVDHVGKSSIGNSLPSFLAGKRFFIAKLHNYSKEAAEEMGSYLNSVRRSGYKSEIFDIFALENRCGRWAAQSDMIYAVAGIASLNIYNCRELIEGWMSIPKKIRIKKYIHRNIFKAMAPEMLIYPFNPGSKYGWLEKYDLTFLLGTYGKYMLEAAKYRKNKKRFEV